MNGQYGTGWLRCVLCSLSAADVAPRNPGDPPVCPNVERCNAVRNGESLGGALWPKKVDLEAPEPPVPDFKGEKPPPIEPDLCSSCGGAIVSGFCACTPQETKTRPAYAGANYGTSDYGLYLARKRLEQAGGFMGPDGSFNL